MITRPDPLGFAQPLGALLQHMFIGAALLILSSVAFAEDFSTTNVQLLYGNDFHDRFLDNNTTDGRMTTMTIEHFGTGTYGDNYFFVDFTSGDFANFSGISTGMRAHVYGEWAPRLSLSALSGIDLSAGAIKDLFLAGQINQSGNGFTAQMAGISVDLAIPLFTITNLTAYARKDNFNRTTWQVTGVWSLPIMPRLHIEGFLDIYGTDSRGAELLTEPQLLFDAGHLFGYGEHVYIGAEWYYTHNKQTTNSIVQGMVKWVW